MATEAPARSSAPGARSDGYPTPPHKRLRRALTLLVMSLVAPGTAQLVAGDHTVGRLAVRAWLWLLGLAGMVALLAWLWPAAFVRLGTSAFLLLVAKVALWVVAAAWSLLILDAWRLGRPASLTPKQRIGTSVLAVCMVALVCAALITAAGIVSAQRSLVSTLFKGADTAAGEISGRYNILLMGGDAGHDRWGLRPDSINLVSIDADSGQAVVFGLPRNLQKVPFPNGSTMDEEFPDGWSCGDACLLNNVYTWAVDNSDKFPGIDEPGVEATRQAVEGITGLDVSYYVLVDMAGFAGLVDAVGGVAIDNKVRVPMGIPGGKYEGWIEPGVQTLDGHRALWYARSRAISSDYERMARQKCVMSAMLRQLDPATVLTNFQVIAQASGRVLETDIPAKDLSGLVDVARKVRETPIQSFSFVPPLVQPVDPDYGLIRATVTAAVKGRELPSEVTELQTGPGGSGQTDNPALAAQTLPAAPAPAAATPTAEPSPAQEATSAPCVPI